MLEEDRTSEEPSKTSEQHFEQNKTSTLPTAFVTLRQQRPQGSSSFDYPLYASWQLDLLGGFFSFANIWRFPLLLHIYGGSFLYSTIIMYLIVGLPALYMQMAVGRITGKNTYELFKSLGSAFSGVAIVMIINLALTLSMAAPFLAQSLYYFFLSFYSELPWAECNSDWALKSCVSVTDLTVGQDPLLANTGRYSVEQFYLRHVLKAHLWDKTAYLGLPDITLSLFLLLAIFITGLLCLALSHIKSPWILVVASALSITPMLCLFGCFIACWFLPGSLMGISYMFTVDIWAFTDYKLWMASLGQVVVSLSLNSLDYITFAAEGDIKLFSLFLTTLTFIVSTVLSHILNSMLIFLILGFMASAISTDVKHVVTGGPGLFFESITAAVSILPHPTLTSVFAFSILSTLILSSVVGGSMYIVDLLSVEFTSRRSRNTIIFLTSLFSFLVGLPICTPGGYYVLSLIDFVSVCILNNIIALTFLIASLWLYGVREFLGILTI